MNNPRLHSNDGTNLVMDILNNANERLGMARELILENNENGKQFDCENVPELAKKVSELEKMIKSISVIVNKQARSTMSLQLLHQIMEKEIPIHFDSQAELDDFLLLLDKYNIPYHDYEAKDKSGVLKYDPQGPFYILHRDHCLSSYGTDLAFSYMNEFLRYRNYLPPEYSS